jgi:hypothetical protein
VIGRAVVVERAQNIRFYQSLLHCSVEDVHACSVTSLHTHLRQAEAASSRS